MFPSNRSEIINNLKTQVRKISIKTAFRRIHVRSARAYVNQFLALPNAMYSHSEYL